MAARFTDLVGTAKVAAFVKHADGRYAYVNSYLLATLGRPQESDWLGKLDAEIWPPDLAARIRSEDEAVLGDGAFAAYTEVMPLDDGPHTFLVIKFPMPTRDGCMGLGGIGVDITGQLKTEGERDRLASAVEQAVESVVITDAEARIIYVNPAFEQVTGYSRDEVIGQNPRLLKSGLQPASFYESMWATLSSGKPWVADLVNRRKDGSFFTEEAVISPMRDPSGEVTGYVAVKRDVTGERWACPDSPDRFAKPPRLTSGGSLRIRPA